jgi:hypothetical protein
MGFRNPVRTASALDTEPNPTGPGARVYQDTSGAYPRGVVELRSGMAGDTPATFALTTSLGFDENGAPNRVFGNSASVTGGGTNGNAAARLDLDQQEAATPGVFDSIARLVGDRIELDGALDWAAAWLYATAASPAYAAGAWVNLDLPGEHFDTHAGHDNGISTTAWITPYDQGSLYLLYGQVVFSQGPAGVDVVRNARITVNGAVKVGVAGEANKAGADVAGTSAGTGLVPVWLNPGDQVRLQGYSSSTWGTAVFADAATNLVVIRVR